jgi:hypothetical protein
MSAAGSSLTGRVTGSRCSCSGTLCSNDVSIEVVDQREDSASELGVNADSALDAFYHPYAHLAFSGIDLEQESPLAA